MRYLLNSAVLTAAGDYRYRLITASEARAWAKKGQYRSTIGYASTAELLASILESEVQVQRDPCAMRAGDEALVCRLAPGFRCRAGMKTGQQGRREAEAMMQAGQFELGLLTRLA